MVLYGYGCVAAQRVRNAQLTSLRNCGYGEEKTKVAVAYSR